MEESTVQKVIYDDFGGYHATLAGTWNIRNIRIIRVDRNGNNDVWLGSSLRVTGILCE